MKDIVCKAMKNRVKRKILRLLCWRTLTESEIANQFDISKLAILLYLNIRKTQN